MHSKKTLNQSIIDITNRIYFEFPELMKYIKEIPSISSVSDDEKLTNSTIKKTIGFRWNYQWRISKIEAINWKINGFKSKSHLHKQHSN